jgi:ABC-type uncharacterized transport system involved in gliding motility auxiliary subunit
MAKSKKSSTRYAVIGLIVALLGCIATGILLLVKGSIALKLYTPADPNTINIAVSISATILVLGLAAYALLNPEGTRRFFTGRHARYGSNSLVMSLAFLGILIVVNLLAFQNPLTRDLTADKTHTLAPESIRAMAALPAKVTAIAFFSTQTPTDTAQTLLSNFKANGKGKFDFRFVDPNSDPLLARQYGVTGDGKIVLTMGKAAETAASADEQLIDQALIRLISPETRVIYFLTGHGEPDINGTDTTALSRARQTLESKNYTVKTLNLAASNKIPVDAKAIVVGGPMSPLLDQEVTLLKAYVDKGGSLIVMEDPTVFTNFGTNPDPLAAYLKTDWGITLDNDVVIDLTSNQPLNAIAASLSSTSPITQHMTVVSILPQSRSLTLATKVPQNVTLIPIASTSPQSQSWGETNLTLITGNAPISFNQATDIPGPLTLAASGENATTGGHVVVFGNSIYATDKAFDAYGNGTIFTNSVDWAAQEKNLIQITPHQPVARTFNAPTQLQLILIILSSVFLIPILILAAGVSTWLARRRQG